MEKDERIYFAGPGLQATRGSATVSSAEFSRGNRAVFRRSAKIYSWRISRGFSGRNSARYTGLYTGRFTKEV
jgi:hypothetical protein